MVIEHVIIIITHFTPTYFIWHNNIRIYVPYVHLGTLKYFSEIHSKIIEAINLVNYKIKTRNSTSTKFKL